MKRIVSLDCVRVFACFFVMVVHANKSLYGAAGPTDMTGPQSFLASKVDRLWMAVYDGFSRMAIPLFMIVSAYLLVPTKGGQTSWQFYRRRFTHILPPFFIFMILHSILLMLWEQIDNETSVEDVPWIFLSFPTLAERLWFMYPLISLYLSIPIISPWLSKATAKEERSSIGLFLLSACMPYFDRWFGEVWGQCFWNEYHMSWYFSGYLGYLMLTHYIRIHLKWNHSKRFIVGLVSMVAGAALITYSFYIQAISGITHSTPVIEVGWAFCTTNCVLLIAGTFLLFTYVNRPEAPRFVTDMLKLSYGIYLIHIFWLGLWATVFKNTLELPIVSAIPCIAVTTSVCCYTATEIISFIPDSKWIIG